MKESLRLSSVNIHHSLQTCFNFHYLLTIKTTCSLRSPFCPALNTKYCQIGEPVFWLLFKSHFRTERDRFCDIYLPDHPPPAPGNIFGGEMCNILTIWSQTDWSAVPARRGLGFPRRVNKSSATVASRSGPTSETHARRPQVFSSFTSTRPGSDVRRPAGMCVSFHQNQVSGFQSVYP